MIPIALILSLASSAANKNKQDMSDQEMADYERNLARAERKQKERDYQAQRMAALGNIMGHPGMQLSGKPVDTPSRPGPVKDNFSDILNAMSQGANAYQAAGGTFGGSKSNISGPSEGAGSMQQPIPSTGGATNPGLWYSPQQYPVRQGYNMNTTPNWMMDQYQS